MGFWNWLKKFFKEDEKEELENLEPKKEETPVELEEQKNI